MNDNNHNYPTPIKEILESRAEGRGGLILDGNTNDRIISPGAGIDTPLSHMYAIFKVLSEKGYHIGNISLTQNFTLVQPGNTNEEKNSKNPFPRVHGTFSKNPSSFMAQFFPALKSREHKVLLWVTGADLILPEAEIAMMNENQLNLINVLINMGLCDSLRQSENIMVLQALQGNVNRALLKAGAFRRISVPLPGEETRSYFISFLRTHPKFSTTIPEDLKVDEMARLTNGCRLIDIEGLGRKASFQGTKITRNAINKIKANAINDISEGQLGVIIPGKTLDDVIGNENIKRFIRYQKALAREGSRSMPSMVVLMGIPGAGKSHLVEAYANEIGWNLVEWKNVRSQWVGQSEARTEKALEIIEQFAPVCVKVDEADQVLGGRSTAGDGGVDSRIFGMLLSRTGDSSLRGRVQWLLTSNRPDLFDAAILDRAGAKIVFLTPSVKERESLFSHLAEQQGKKIASDVDLKLLAAHQSLQMASVRNLIEIIGQAGQYADIEAREINALISQKHLERAIREFHAGDTLETEFIALHSLNQLRFSEQLPWIAADGKLLEHYDFPLYLKDIVDPQSGKMDTQKLSEKLRDISILRSRERILK